MKHCILAAGPLFKKPGAVPSRIILRADPDGSGYFEVRTQFYPQFPDLKRDAVSCQTDGRGHLARATEAFSRRVAAQARDLAGDLESRPVARDLDLLAYGPTFTQDGAARIVLRVAPDRRLVVCQQFFPDFPSLGDAEALFPQSYPEGQLAEAVDGFARAVLADAHLAIDSGSDLVNP